LRRESPKCSLCAFWEDWRQKCHIVEKLYLCLESN